MLLRDESFHNEYSATSHFATKHFTSNHPDAHDTRAACDVSAGREARRLLQVRKAFCMFGCVKSVTQRSRSTGPSTTDAMSARRGPWRAGVGVWRRKGRGSARWG